MTKFGYLVLVLIISTISLGGYGVYYLSHKISNVEPVQTASEASSSSTVEAVVATTPEVATGSIVYINEDFGFKLTLPSTWVGYKVSTGTVDRGQSVTITPVWSTNDKNREFVPVLIYPKDVWTAWEKNNFEDYKTSAPIGPTERGRNSDFVFATAPRYNFSFGTGTEEVEGIVKSIKSF